MPFLKKKQIEEKPLQLIPVDDEGQIIENNQILDVQQESNQPEAEKIAKPLTEKQKKLLNNAQKEILATDFSSLTTTHGFYIQKSYSATALEKKVRKEIKLGSDERKKDRKEVQALLNVKKKTTQNYHKKRIKDNDILPKQMIRKEHKELEKVKLRDHFSKAVDDFEFKVAPKAIAEVADTLNNWVPARHSSENKIEFFEKSFKAAAAKQTSFFSSKENKIRYQNWSDLESYDKSKNFLSELKPCIESHGAANYTSAIKKIITLIDEANNLKITYKEAHEKINIICEAESAKLSAEERKRMQRSPTERTGLFYRTPKMEFASSFFDDVRAGNISLQSRLSFAPIN